MCFACPDYSQIPRAEARWISCRRSHRRRRLGLDHRTGGWYTPDRDGTQRIDYSRVPVAIITSPSARPVVKAGGNRRKISFSRLWGLTKLSWSQGRTCACLGNSAPDRKPRPPTAASGPGHRGKQLRLVVDFQPDLLRFHNIHPFWRISNPLAALYLRMQTAVSTWHGEMKLIVISSVLVRKKRGQEHIHRFTVHREHIHCLAVRKEHIDKPCRCQLISSWE